MPLIRLTVPDHLPDTQVQALAQAVHGALVACCNVPAQDRFIVVTRLPGSALMLDPHFPNVQRSRDACIVDITLLVGRSNAQKQAFYRHAADAAERCGIRPDDLLMSLAENTAMDWSLGRGVAYGAEAHH
ncbi:MAG: tautomerase family protein [Burkholderiales bacterium]|nr:tautomerase family protein [Burkholderiales bacterium]